LYWGAGEEITKNYWLLVTLGELAAVMFLVFGMYAFSGAGLIRRLPFQKSVLYCIGAIYALRGLVILPQIMMMTNAIDCEQHQFVPVRMLVASFVSLAIGAMYLIGTHACSGKNP
jgi:putative oxidoreductase